MLYNSPTFYVKPILCMTTSCVKPILCQPLLARIIHCHSPRLKFCEKTPATFTVFNRSFKADSSPPNLFYFPHNKLHVPFSHMYSFIPPPKDYLLITYLKKLTSLKMNYFDRRVTVFMSLTYSTSQEVNFA